MFNLYLHCRSFYLLLPLKILFRLVFLSQISFHSILVSPISLQLLLALQIWFRFIVDVISVANFNLSLLQLSNIDFDFSVAVYITDFISYLVLVDTPSTNFTLIATPAFQCNFHFGCCCIMDNFSFPVDFTWVASSIVHIISAFSHVHSVGTSITVFISSAYSTSVANSNLDFILVPTSILVSTYTTDSIFNLYLHCTSFRLCL